MAQTASPRIRLSLEPFLAPQRSFSHHASRQIVGTGDIPVCGIETPSGEDELAGHETMTHVASPHQGFLECRGHGLE